VNFAFLSFLALSRTWASSLGAACCFRRCVRSAFCSSTFPSAARRPSTLSSAALPASFERFVGTMGASDFPLSFTIGLRSCLPNASRFAIEAGDEGISRFSRRKVPYVLGVFDRARPMTTSRLR